MYIEYLLEGVEGIDPDVMRRLARIDVLSELYSSRPELFCTFNAERDLATQEVHFTCDGVEGR